MRKKRNNNRAIDKYRDAYVLKLFVEFIFSSINMHC